MRLAPLLLFIVSACEPDIPQTVYVPAPQYQQQLRIAMLLGDEAAARTGVAVPAVGSTYDRPLEGDIARFANLEECWWGGPPPEREPEVAANVHWHVEPSDSVTFNVPMPPNLDRTIHFARAGVYRLWAQSHGCPKQLFSDTLTISVR